MIVKTFNNGWGDQLPLKRVEREILDRFLSRYWINDQRCVIINNTWYTDEFHLQVMRDIDAIQPDRIFLVSMLDPPMIKQDFYQDSRIQGIGYFPGPGEIDFWALAVGSFMSIPEIKFDPDIAFMCLNRKPHWHRIRLFNQMQQANLLDLGMVSMGGNDGRALRLLPDDLGGSDMAPNAGTDQNGINNDIFSLGNANNWNRCLVNIVTETIYDVVGGNFVSEKIYKPILGQRPFLVHSPGGARSWLENRGFQTYLDDWRDITDLDLANPNNIVPFLSVLCEQPRFYLRKKLLDLQPKIMYNKNRFHAYCTEQKDIIERGLSCPV